jgi:hypothetical protein
MSISEEHIAEIAEYLECGMLCFYHRPTETIEFYPDEIMEEELWEELIDKIESDRNNYDRFEKMDSRQSFKVMEDFAVSLKDDDFKAEAFERLSNRKPFRNFKYLIEASEYRQDWFDFKKQAYIQWVKEQIEDRGSKLLN